MRKHINCTDYEDCPKNVQVENLDYKEKNSFNFLFVGCWGVYCSGKGTKIKSYDKKRNIFEEDTKSKYGQKQVVDSMVKFSDTFQQDALILAGDNVYSDIYPSEEIQDAIIKAGEDLKDIKDVEDSKQMLEIINFFLKNINDICDCKYTEKLSKQVVLEILEKFQRSTEAKFAHNKKINKAFKQVKSQLLNMEKQLDEGFAKCISNVKADNFFIGVGNHDIESCDVINKQLNYQEKKWKMPALSYNILVNMEGFDVNLIFIDTNMYDKKWCEGNYPLSAQKEQKNWLESVLSDKERTWNIVIGHVPFACDPHKETDGEIITRVTEGLIELIADNREKIDLYMCADEHNQHYVKYKDGNISFPPQVIAGSGGNKLDTTILESLPRDQVLLSRSVFGYVSVKVTKEKISLKFEEVPYDPSDPPRDKSKEEENFTIERKSKSLPPFHPNRSRTI
jgi:hypothetical protein